MITNDTLVVLWTTERFYSVIHFLIVLVWFYGRAKAHTPPSEEDGNFSSASFSDIDTDADPGDWEEVGYRRLPISNFTSVRSSLIWWLTGLSCLAVVGLGAIVKYTCRFYGAGYCHWMVPMEGWDAW